MVERYTHVHGVTVPRLIYGTAWKEDATSALTSTAIGAGFRGIDTANQRRHYDEAGVGEALAAAFAKGMRRQDLFIQTKFTYRIGQDHRLPYNPSAALAEQVEQSFASSLGHLGVDYVDAYLLHGPSRRRGLGDADWEVWAAMERLHAAGKTRLLGVSNVSVEQLDALCAAAAVKPAVVQNRCFAHTGWDRDVRQLCEERGMLYEGFSLLTANRDILRLSHLQDIAAKTGKTLAQVIFRFALQVGMVGLTGTTSAEHMQQDLDIFDFELNAADVEAIETAAL